MAESTIQASGEKITARQLFNLSNFRFIWSGQVISDFGDSMTRLALLLMVNALTGSVSAIATMTIVLSVPRLIFGFLSGVYVDHFDRKRLMIYSDALRGVLVLGFLLVDSPEKIWILYLVGFLQGTVTTFFEPARMAILPNLIPIKGLLAANSITQTSQMIFFTLGNAAAGVLVGVFHSYALVFIINAFTFFLSALLIVKIQYSPASQHQKPRLNASLVMEQLREGVRICFSNRILAGTIVAISLTMLGVGATNILMVPLMINDMAIPETWLGAVNAGETAGMILSGVLIAGLASRISSTRMVIIGLLGFGITTMGIAVSHSIAQLMLVLFVSGLFIPPITASTLTILQMAVPDELRGRTSGARVAISMVANLISMGLAGILADQIGARTVFIIGGGFAVLGGLAAWYAFRGVEKQDVKSEKLEISPP